MWAAHPASEGTWMTTALPTTPQSSAIHFGRFIPVRGIAIRGWVIRLSPLAAHEERAARRENAQIERVLVSRLIAKRRSVEAGGTLVIKTPGTSKMVEPAPRLEGIVLQIV